MLVNLVRNHDYKLVAQFRHTSVNTFSYLFLSRCFSRHSVFTGDFGSFHKDAQEQPSMLDQH